MDMKHSSTFPAYSERETFLEPSSSMREWSCREPSPSLDTPLPRVL
jgi:hypothetical protein